MRRLRSLSKTVLRRVSEICEVDSVVQCIRRNDVSAAEKELQRLAR